MTEYQTIENKLKAQLTKVVAGRKLLLGVYDHNNLDEFGNAKLLAVAGQQGLTLNREGDTIDTTSKSGGGWMEQIKGLKEWSIDMDGIYVTEDDSHDKLIELYNSDEGLVLITIYNAVTKDVMAAGLALLNSYPIEAPYDDVTTYSASFTGTGQLLSGKEIESVNGGDVEDPDPEDPYPEDPDPEDPSDFTGPLNATTFVDTQSAGDGRIVIEVELGSWENAVTSITDPDGTIHKGVAEDGPIYDAHDFGDPEHPHTYTVQSWGWRIAWNLPKTPEALGDYQFIVEGNGGQTETVTITVDESHITEGGPEEDEPIVDGPIVDGPIVEEPSE